MASSLPAASAAVTNSPGAATSGFSAPMRVGPRLENDESEPTRRLWALTVPWVVGNWFRLTKEPTAMHRSSVAGMPIAKVAGREALRQGKLLSA